MLKLAKRDFLKLTGLAIAEKLVPPWVWARTGEPSRSERKLVVVTFGGGCRFQEALAREGIRNTPRLAAPKPQGRFFSNCVNSGVLSHHNSTSTIVTGNCQRVDDCGFDRPPSPTALEH